MIILIINYTVLLLIINHYMESFEDLLNIKLSLKDKIKDKKYELHKLQCELNKVNKKLVEICNHDYVMFRDTHDKYYECKHCGEVTL